MPAITDKLCCICGIRPSTTVEHIPPKCIFPSPRPAKTITVPACKECNESTSIEDEEFRVVVNLFAGKTTPETQRLWESRTLPTLNKNKRLLNKAKASFQPGYLTSKGGIILDELDLVVWDDSPNKVLDKIVRGLYFYHFDEILADRVNISIHQVQNLTMEKVDCLNSLQSNYIGDCQFLYRYGRAHNDPLCSVWFLMFQKALMVVCNTNPK